MDLRSTGDVQSSLSLLLENSRTAYANPVIIYCWIQPIATYYGKIDAASMAVVAIDCKIC